MSFAWLRGSTRLTASDVARIMRGGEHWILTDRGVMYVFDGWDAAFVTSPGHGLYPRPTLHRSNLST